MKWGLCKCYRVVIVWPSGILQMPDLSSNKRSQQQTSLTCRLSPVPMRHCHLSAAITCHHSCGAFVNTEHGFICTNQGGMAWPGEKLQFGERMTSYFRRLSHKQEHLPLPAQPPPYTHLHPSTWPTISPFHTFHLVCIQSPSDHCVPKCDPSLSPLFHSCIHPFTP